MKLNPIELEILGVLKEDMLNSGKDYSILTNNEISKKINVSVFSVRDKIIGLANKKVIIKRNDVWDQHKKFHNRIIYLK